MRSSYNRRRAIALSTHMRRMANARWKADRQRRDEEEPARLREIAEVEAVNLPHKQGDPLGCLQWTDFSTGQVRRWVVRIGDRRGRVTLEPPGGMKTLSCGWTAVMDDLRGILAGTKT